MDPLPSVRRHGGDRVDRLVEGARGPEPAVPEPAQVLASVVFDRPEEVGRRRVLEGPAAGVLPERPVELTGAEHLVAKEPEAEAGLLVGHHAEPGGAVGGGESGLFVPRQREVHHRVH